MWFGMIEWLKDARLVAKIQEGFGVEIHNLNCTRQDDSRQKSYGGAVAATTLQQFENDVRNRGQFCENRKANGCNVTEVKKDGDMTDDDLELHVTEPSNAQYTITNYFWYYLFLFGTELGDEIFYSAFIPFWFWNIDGSVGRRVVLVWATVMSIGQALKDIICWPRPECPPAARLQSKWSQEYGMPSTHAMVGVSIPFSVVLFTMHKYIYPVSIGWMIASIWCALVSISRLYLGMHTVLDILAGLVLAIFLMIPLVPLIDFTDYYIVSNLWALAILVAVTIAAVVYYPCGKRWTPTRGDTTMVVSVTAGVHVGAWLNYVTETVRAPLVPPPYHITWPTYFELGQLIFRTILGFSSVIATKIICKALTYVIMCAILNINCKNLMESKDFATNRNKVLVDLVYKYVTCFMIGVNTVYVLPNFFTLIGIERPTFYTEV